MIDNLFENLSRGIWFRIRDTCKSSIRQDEETLTDNILLEILRSEIPSIQVIQTSKVSEKEKGTDWEWWLGSEKFGWLRYAIQAKKLHPQSQNYPSLNHLSGKKPDRRRQVDVLNEYASKNNAIPLYCFYNYLEVEDHSDLQKYWHQRKEQYQIEQFGWTFTPIETVLKILDNKVPGNKKFHNIHMNKDTLPMKYLCNSSNSFELLKNLKQRAKNGEEVIGYVQELPSYFDNMEFIIEKEEEELREQKNSISYKTADYGGVPKLSLFKEISPFENNYIIQKASSLPEEYYDAKTGLYPKRILKIDLDL